MSTDLHRAWLDELVVERQRGRVERWFSRVHRLEQTLLPTLPLGPAGIHQALDALESFSSEWFVSVEQQVHEREEVVTRFVAHGRQIGPIGPIAANRRALPIHGLLWTRFSGGRAYETILEVSALELLRSLDAVRVSTAARGR